MSKITLCYDAWSASVRPSGDLVILLPLPSFADASGGDLQLGDGPLRALLPLQLAPPHGDHLQRVQGELFKRSKQGSMIPIVNRVLKELNRLSQ